MKRFILSLLFIILACCNSNAQNPFVSDSDSVSILDITPMQKDSLIFRLKHHYSENFNFLVKADSIMLIPREGDIIQDTCWVHKDNVIAVAEIKILQDNPVDSVWVKVASAQNTMGWLPEKELLSKTIPNDQISELIYILTNSRIFWMSAFIIFGIFAYLFHRGESRRLYLLKFDEMRSIYPFLFVALVSTLSIIYSSIQCYVPEYWQEYYFHPVLSPIGLPFIMAVLVSLAWLVVVIFFAVVDEVYHHYYFAAGIAYIFELLGIAMFAYLVISWTTSIYVGYSLHFAVLIILGWTYFKFARKGKSIAS